MNGALRIYHAAASAFWLWLGTWFFNRSEGCKRRSVWHHWKAKRR